MRRRADKPGSVRPATCRSACAARPPAGRAIIHLARAPDASRRRRRTRAAYPRVRRPHPLGTRRHAASNPTRCLALLRARFAVPPASPPERWALTPPFHPYRTSCSVAAQPSGGLFSAALSVVRAKARTPGHYPAPCSAEPGLSSAPVTDRGDGRPASCGFHDNRSLAATPSSGRPSSGRPSSGRPSDVGQRLSGRSTHGRRRHRHRRPP